MRVNRRDFVRVGGLGTAGLIAASCGPSSGPQSGTPQQASGGPPIDVEIQVKGLVLAHWTKPALRLYLINGELVGMPKHVPRLIVPAALIDASSTVPHTPHPTDPSRRIIDLLNKDVTVPGTGSAPPAVTANEGSIGSTIPPNAGAWAPIRYSAYLPSLCGATSITDSTKFYGNVLINHGQLRCAQPEGATGNTTIWTFKHPTTGLPVTPSQAISNVLVCSTKITPAQAGFLIGSQTLVLVPGQAGVVVFANEPQPLPPGNYCPAGQLVCAEHLSAYYNLVNATVKPIAEGALPPATPPLIDNNYCPPGFLA